MKFKGVFKENSFKIIGSRTPGAEKVKIYFATSGKKFRKTFKR